MPEVDPAAAGSINVSAAPPQSRSTGDDARPDGSASLSVGSRDAGSVVARRSHRRAASADDVAAMTTPSSVSSPPPRRGRRRNSLDDGIGPIWASGGSVTSSTGTPRRGGAPPRRSISLPPPGSPSLRRQPQARPPSRPDDRNKSLLWDAARFLVGAGTKTASVLLGTPWHAAQRHFIPKITHDFAAYYESLAPHRVKAWVHLLSRACGNLVEVLGRTEAGREFGESLVDAGGSAADWLSAAEVRQFVVDGMSLWVKSAEALRTPETREALQQAALLTCRAVDAASTGRAKQLYYDLADATWSAIELAADPATTVAVAEVTAHLCHALESETYLGEHNPLSSSMGGYRRVRRRRERDSRVARTFGDDRFERNVDRGEGPGVSTEEVILSSLGDGTRLIQRGSVGRASGAGSAGGEDNGADTEVDGDETKADPSESSSQFPKIVDTDTPSESPEEEERVDLEENTVSSIADLTTESNVGHALQDEGRAERTDEGRIVTFPANRINEDRVQPSETSHEPGSADAVCDVQYIRDGIAARADTMRVAKMVARGPGGTKVGETLAVPRENVGHFRDRERDERAAGNDEDIEELERPAPSEGRKNPSEAGEKGAIRYEERRTQKMNEMDASKDMHRTDGSRNSSDQNGDKEHGTETAEDRDAYRSRKPSDENVGSSQLFSNVYSGSISAKRARLIETLLNLDAVDDCASPENSPLEANKESTASGGISRIIKRWYPLAAAAAGAGDKDGQDSLKQSALPTRAKQNGPNYPRSRIGVENSLEERILPNASGEAAFERYMLCFGLLIIVIVVACIVWFILGCYGFYLFFLADKSQISSPEVIVRVVREVVHVAPDGFITPAAQTAAENLGRVIYESTIPATAEGFAGTSEL